MRKLNFHLFVRLPPTQDIVTPIGMMYNNGVNTRSAKLTAVASDMIIS